MTEFDRHSTQANSKVSDQQRQNFYTPLVEVIQALLAWSVQIYMRTSPISQSYYPGYYPGLTLELTLVSVS